MTYDALPEPVRALARQCVLDYYGVALAGADDPLAKMPARRTGRKPAARRRPASSATRRGSRPVGRAGQRRRSATRSITTTSTWRCRAIPSVAILPGLLALAEQRRSSGREVIAAFVAGYETACRIGMALRAQPLRPRLSRHRHGRRVRRRGGVRAPARSRRRERRRGALGIAGTQAAGLKSQFGTMCKPFHAGKASQSGFAAPRGSRRAGFSSRPDLVECEQGFALTHGARFQSRGRARDTAERVSHLRQPLQVSRRLLPDARADRDAPAACAMQHGVAPEQVARMTTCRSTAAATGSATSRRRPTGSKPSSACARTWRWRCPGSIRRASAPTASRRRPTPLCAAAREARARFP